MTNKKKLTIAIIVTCITLFATILTAVIVLVSTLQYSESDVNVRYNAEAVHVEVSANAHIGTTKYAFKNGTSTKLEITPKNKTGQLAHEKTTSTGLSLDSSNDRVIFEYIFTNKTDDIDVEISLTDIATTMDNIINLDIAYVFSNKSISDFSLVDTHEDFSNQLIPAYNDGKNYTKYIYIIATIDNLLENAKIEGDFEWNLNRADEVITYNLNLGERDYIEGTSQTSVHPYKELATNGLVDPGVYPAKVNKYFAGWATSDTATSALEYPYTPSEISNIINLYPVYLDGTVPTTAYQYSSGSYTIKVVGTGITDSIPHLVIPDIVQIDSNSIGKVTKIANGAVGTSYKGAFCNNKTIQTITMGRYLNTIGSVAFRGCTALTKINFNNLVTAIPVEFVRDCTTLQTIDIPDTITSIGDRAFRGCTGITSFTLPKNVRSIASSVFYGTANTMKQVIVDEENPVFDSRNNCNAIIETATATLQYGFKTTTIPNGIRKIGPYAFTNCSMTSINIPNTVSEINNYAFNGCSSMTSLTIPKSVTKIGNYFVNSCSKLTSLTFEETNGWWYSTSSTATSGTSINVSNPTTNATNLKGSYKTYYLYRT